MCNAGSWRHHTQKESKRITRGRKSKNEKLISRGLFGLEKCGKLKRFPLETRLPSQSESNMWPQHVPRRQEPSMQNRVPNVKKKKKRVKKKEGHIYTYKISSHTQPKYVHPCESKQNSSYSCVRLRYGRHHE